MANIRANMIKARGLVTYSNELAVPEGSQRQAVNVNIDEQGVITSRRGFNDYAGPTTGSSDSTAIVSQIMEYKDAIIRQYQDKIEYEDANGDFQVINGTYSKLREGYRTKYQESNSNLYFTADVGIQKMSVKDRLSLNSNMISSAGGVKAGYSAGKSLSSIGGFLPPESKVAYRVIFGTKDSNNNLIFGSPSSRFIVSNYNNRVLTQETSSINTLAGSASFSEDDYFTYVNSTGKYVIYIDLGTSTEPKTSETIGGTYIKVSVTGLSDVQIAAVLANAISVIPNTIISIDSTISTKVLIESTEEGDISGISIAKASDGTTDISARMLTLTDSEGDVEEGISSTVEVTGVVPNRASTDYFYQVYRSGTISVSVGLTMNDLDPGDELNLVYESGLTDAEITAGEFSFIDTTPESFRAEAPPLYTNNVTGEGILQANEVPPIALDIELFRGYMFYANTKEKHRSEFTIVSIDDFISGSTRIVIGNSDITRYYNFVGTSEVRDITISTVPVAGDYINLYSANDERQYYIYFGILTDDPNISGSTGYRIDLTGAPSTADIATRIETALINNIDFNLAVASNIVTFSYTNNGYTTGITSGVGVGVTISVPSVSGTGELSYDALLAPEGGDILLSGLISVGQSIDETARSLVKIISKDSLSPVNAYYLSNSEDLPGNILLEARSLEDKNFYISIEENAFNPLVIPSDFNIGEEFTPNLPISRDIEEFTGTNVLTNIKRTDHGYSTGDEVFVGYYKDPNNVLDPSSFSGVYSITKIDDHNFSIVEPTPNTVVAFPPTFSTIASPDVESDNKELPNRIYYSKKNEPEAVPVINFIDIGTQDGEIKRILALRDNLFILKDDGIFVVSGTSAPDWSVRLIDSTKIIAPDSAVVLNNQIYCLTEQGVTRITGSGAAIISRGIEDQIDLITNQQFDFSSNTFGIAYENDRAFIMFAPKNSSDASATQAFRYNIFEQTWSRWEFEATCGHVLARDNKMYVGNADRNYISQERKNNNRTDNSDRNFTASINPNGILENVMELSTLIDVSVNDVVVQEQEVSINYINNRLLRKMDFFDTGITPPISSTMFDSFSAKAGDNIPTIMEAINDHLVTLDAVNITARLYTQANVRAFTEAFVDELNTTATITEVKTYKKPETVLYEAFIESIEISKNRITTHVERPFIEGFIEVYKGFTCTVEWNPQHFGDPSALKQISYMTIMFDQNNFYNASASFASDAAQSLTTVDFKGKGIGYWGDMSWSAPNHYWGGVGNDIPFRTPVPRGKQKCRYISLTFEHKNAREKFRIVGISAVVRAISDKAYR